MFLKLSIEYALCTFTFETNCRLTCYNTCTYQFCQLHCQRYTFTQNTNIEIVENQQDIIYPREWAGVKSRACNYF